MSSNIIEKKPVQYKSQPLLRHRAHKERMFGAARIVRFKSKLLPVFVFLNDKTDCDRVRQATAYQNI